MAQDDADMIRKQIEDGMKDSIRRAMGEVWDRLAVVLNKLMTKMSEKDGIFTTRSSRTSVTSATCCRDSTSPTTRTSTR